MEVLPDPELGDFRFDDPRLQTLFEIAKRAKLNQMPDAGVELRDPVSGFVVDRTQVQGQPAFTVGGETFAADIFEMTP